MARITIPVWYIVTFSASTGVPSRCIAETPSDASDFGVDYDEPFFAAACFKA